MKSNISIQGALRVEYRVQLQSRGENSALIASERRLAGGEGAVSALVLAQLGARVRLSGNAIGDDSHGRFLLSLLQNVPNLELNIEVQSGVITPYAILVRDGEGQIQTLLSSEAAQLEGEQDYPALLRALKNALNQWQGEDGDEAEIERIVRAYDTSFGDFASLPHSPS